VTLIDINRSSNLLACEQSKHQRPCHAIALEK
jgi:hypothetical protein